MCQHANIDSSKRYLVPCPLSRPMPGHSTGDSCPFLRHTSAHTSIETTINRPATPLTTPPPRPCQASASSPADLPYFPIPRCLSRARLLCRALLVCRAHARLERLPQLPVLMHFPQDVRTADKLARHVDLRRRHTLREIDREYPSGCYCSFKPCLKPTYKLHVA